MTSFIKTRYTNIIVTHCNRLKNILQIAILNRSRMDFTWLNLFIVRVFLLTDGCSTVYVSVNNMSSQVSLIFGAKGAVRTTKARRHATLVKQVSLEDVGVLIALATSGAVVALVHAQETHESRPVTTSSRCCRSSSAEALVSWPALWNQRCR